MPENQAEKRRDPEAAPRPTPPRFGFGRWWIALGLITITGILKAMRYVFPIPGDALDWVSAIHIGAMVVLAIKLLDHLRYVLAPSRWWMMRAMVPGSPTVQTQQQAAPTPEPGSGS